MSRNVPRQPQSEAEKAKGLKLWAASMARAEKLAALGKQKPVVWRQEADAGDEERGL